MNYLRKMLVLILNGIFFSIVVIESSPRLTDDHPENQCVLRNNECKPSLQRPCCNTNDYCKQAESGGSSRCTEKIFTPGLGRFCDVDEDCDEIWHSKCSRNECVCRRNNVEYNKTVCSPILGGFCWKNEMCVTENSVCIDQECRCKDNYSLISKQCKLKILGAHCENDEICQQVKFAKCSDKNICACSSNTLSVNQTHCVSLLEGFCWSDNDCLTHQSICVDNKCKCRHGMTFFSNKCVEAFIDMSCLNDVDCRSFIPHSKCSQSYRCTCEPYYSEYKKKCVPNSLIDCIDDYSCRGTNSDCIENVCQCKRGFVYRPDVCVPVSLGDWCMNNHYCHPIHNAICSIDKVCVCNKNHTRKTESSCIPLLGGACKVNKDCTASNSTCSNSSCQCKPNFVKRTENECTAAMKLGMRCTYDNDCRDIKNSKCSDIKTCECIRNFVRLSSTECVSVLGTPHRSVSLNKNCQSNDGFVPPEKKYKQCFTRINCERDNDCEQISNAKCIDNTCSCREYYAMISNTTCAPLLGEYCQPQQQCANWNSQCIDKKCQCDDDYVNYFNNICVSKAGHFRISCKNDYYCNSVKYSVCSDEKKCSCKPNYVALGNDQCIALIGEYCDSNSECISYNTVCVDHQCQCPEKFTMKTKYQCDRISLGRTCQTDHDCNTALKNSACSKDKVCICKENHYALNHFQCVPYLKESCLIDSDCHSNFSACIGNVCQCKLSYRGVSANQCVLFGSLYSCKGDFECGDPWHNKCSTDGRCICNTNNTYINRSTCSPLLGGYCWTDHQCVVKDSRCVDFQCKCRDSFRTVSTNMCMPVRQ